MLKGVNDTHCRRGWQAFTSGGVGTRPYVGRGSAKGIMMSLNLSALASVVAVPAFLKMASRTKKVTLLPLNAPIVLPAAQMVRLIKRECARIDRNGLFCALAVFSVPDTTNTDAVAQSLVDALRERARLTDVVGWLDNKTLCTFLTDATLEGATAFAESVKTAMAAHLPS
jgi:hypothetical protein